MALYYVNKKAQSNGDNEVHKEPCDHMPSAANRKSLGSFDNCAAAVREAKKTYPDTANGCFYCSLACHTS